MAVALSEMKSGVSAIVISPKGLARPVALTRWRVEQTELLQLRLTVRAEKVLLFCSLRLVPILEGTEEAVAREGAARSPLQVTGIVGIG
jgi:hypothetical protein